MAAISVLMLVDRGALDLHASVNHLMSHSAGLSELDKPPGNIEELYD